MSWRIYMDGRDLGIVETNYPYASAYWEERRKKTGRSYKMVQQ